VRPGAVLSATDADTGAVDTVADALHDYYDTHGWDGVSRDRDTTASV